MDTGLHELENAFGVEFGLSKADRLRTGESAMTHGKPLIDPLLCLNSELMVILLRSSSNVGTF